MPRGLFMAAALLLALLAAPPGALAAGAEDTLASLQVQSGGVGAEDRLAPPGYQAQLIFANPRGEYLAGVRVIFRREGVAREVFSPGPWLFVKGRPGRYEVEARVGEAAARAALSLPAVGMAVLVLRLR
ncbi:MAG: hypothetical protein AABZ64_08485 [Nitrospinota bacterium]